MLVEDPNSGGIELTAQHVAHHVGEGESSSDRTDGLAPPAGRGRPGHSAAPFKRLTARPSCATILLMASRRRASWLKTRPIMLTGLTLALGVAIGWILGSRAACGAGWSACAFDTALLEAVGTWFGALATAGALVYAAMQLRTEVERRREERERHQHEQEERQRKREEWEDQERQRQEEDLEEARACRLSLRAVGEDDNKPLESVLTIFTNRTSRRVTGLAVYHEGTEVGRRSTVKPGELVCLPSFRIEGVSVESRKAAWDFLDRVVTPELMFEFSIDGGRRYRSTNGDLTEISLAAGVGGAAADTPAADQR